MYEGVGRVGDAEAFRAFVAARLPALSRTAYLLTGDHHAAEDLVQTALMRTAGVWSRVRGDPEAYVRRVMYTENVSRWRWRSRRPEVVTDRLPERSGGDDVGGADRRLVVADALARLTPRQRTVLVLRFYEDLGVEATAEVMGCSAGTVKSQTRHAIGRLRVLAPGLAELVGTEVDP